MYKYRLSKYNPSYRSASGAYTKDEWTSFSDIGKSFDGMPLTKEVYYQLETRYIQCISDMLQSLNIECLTLSMIEHRGKFAPPTDKCHLLNVDAINASLKGGIAQGMAQIEHIIRAGLREMLWCTMTSSSNTISIAFGYDYYLRISAKTNCDHLQKIAHIYNLYFESIGD